MRAHREYFTAVKTVYILFYRLKLSLDHWDLSQQPTEFFRLALPLILLEARLVSITGSTELAQQILLSLYHQVFQEAVSGDDSNSIQSLFEIGHLSCPASICLLPALWSKTQDGSKETRKMNC